MGPETLGKLVCGVECFLMCAVVIGSGCVPPSTPPFTTFLVHSVPSQWVLTVSQLVWELTISRQPIQKLLLSLPYFIYFTFKFDTWLGLVEGISCLFKRGKRYVSSKLDLSHEGRNF